MMKEPRRGRRSHENIVDQVIQLFRQERFKLDNCDSFDELPGVQALERQLLRKTLRRGTALDLLIQGAVTDAQADLLAAETPRMRQFGVFLQLWFRDRKSIVEIAATLQLDRTTVGRAIKRPALDLVAEHFLHLARQEDPLAESDGARTALHYYEERQRQS